MAVRDAVLSQSPEFKEARIHAYDNATAIYDLLTIALVRWGHSDLLHEVRYRITVELRICGQNADLFVLKALLVWTDSQFVKFVMERACSVTSLYLNLVKEGWFLILRICCFALRLLFS
jgi:hypothetical protein